MLLTQRLSLLVAVILVTALGAFVVLGDLIFAQLQHRDAVALLERELDRAQVVLRSGTLGEDFLQDRSGRIVLQFVTTGGRTVLPEEGAEALPLHRGATEVELGGVPYVVASGPWVLPSGFEIGTIRMALDMRPAATARAALRAGLAVGGITIAALALLIATWSIGGSLAPLSNLAREAAAIDPAAPRLARYEGPEDEVARLAGALNRALDAIAMHHQKERDALAEIAHELAAPLTVVAGQLRTLEATTPHDTRLRAARTAADELLHTSQDLLLLARGELEREGELEAVDAAAVATAVAEEYPGVRVTVSGSAVVLADRSRLRQVVRNLIRNAVQAVGAGDGVTVRVRAIGDSVHLEVADRGPGMSDEEQLRVFDRYFSRQRPGARSGRGAGVGLAVVKRLVESFEGTVRVRSAPGAGATFTVQLPSLAAFVEREAVPHEPLPRPAVHDGELRPLPTTPS